MSDDKPSQDSGQDNAESEMILQSLIDINVQWIEQKVELLPDDNFMRQWILVVSAHIEGLLSKLFFDDSNEFFSTNLRLSQGAETLRPTDTFEFFKLAGGFFLASFLSKGDLPLVVSQTESGAQAFIDDVFLIFNFTPEDKELYHKNAPELSENSEHYFHALYAHIQEKVLNVQPSGAADESILLGTLFLGSYAQFALSFKEKMSSLY